MPENTMELYETDIEPLQRFIETVKIEKDFSEEYLILYNFATDLKYATYIQPELVRYLLPFYCKAIEQTVLYKNNAAMDIYCEFNSAISDNRLPVKNAVGEKDYQKLMTYYIQLTLQKMERENLQILEWVSLFNTTIVFCDDNIRCLFQQIFNGSLEIKYAFFQYLSVFLFKESDNLLAGNEMPAFWTSMIFDFDASTNTLFWSDTVVSFFDREINKKRIETLYSEVQPILHGILQPEIVTLFQEELNKSFDTGVFYHRKAEYLEKMACKDREVMEASYWYWDDTF